GAVGPLPLQAARLCGLKPPASAAASPDDVRLDASAPRSSALAVSRRSLRGRVSFHPPQHRSWSSTYGRVKAAEVRQPVVGWGKQAVAAWASRLLPPGASGLLPLGASRLSPPGQAGCR